MARIGLVALGLMVLGHLLLTQAVQARADDELSSSWNRDAADAEDWIERGRASVTESPVFPDGIRLTARAVEEGEAFEPGVASAIYRFPVPDWAHYAEISVRYNDVSKDDEVAGRLWIKVVDNEAAEAVDPAEEVPLYGDTFVLRSDRNSETIHVPCTRHAEEGSFELHIVAEGTDCLDVKSLWVTYLEEKPAGMRVVRHSCDDYWYSWPRHRYVYHYYYWGPCYWPRASLVYVWWDWPSDFYWRVWRPWFRLYVRAHCARPWWGPRQYTLVYHGSPGDSPAGRLALFRKRLRERHGSAPFHARTPPGYGVTSYKQIRTGKGLAAKRGSVPLHRQLKRRPAPVDEQPRNPGIKPHFLGRDYKPQRILRPKSRRVSPSYAQEREVQGRLRSRTAPRISRPRLENRGNVRIPADPAREATLKNQIPGQLEIRKNSMPRTRPTMKTPLVRSRGLALGKQGDSKIRQ